MNGSTRRRSIPVRIGGVTIGGDAPIVVQSMTNTDTADVTSTAAQVAALARAGSELVRVTVDRTEAAAAVPYIRERLDILGVNAPLIGDFHYNGHRLLTDHPDCAAALSKYRINPGNVGKGDKRDRQFSMMIEAAMRHDKPVRIGVNWGSLDQELLASLMDDNARRAEENMHSASVCLRWIDRARPGRERQKSRCNHTAKVMHIYSLLMSVLEKILIGRTDV